MARPMYKWEKYFILVCAWALVAAALVMVLAGIFDAMRRVMGLETATVASVLFIGAIFAAVAIGGISWPTKDDQ